MKLPFGNKTYLLVILLVLVFLILNFTGSYLNIKNFFYKISSPLQVLFWQWGDNVSDFFAPFFTTSALLEKVQELSLKNQELLAELAVLREIKQENEALRQALNIGLEKEFQLVLARVISKDISQDSLLVGKGKKDGILTGLPAVSPQKVLVGQVGKVYEDFSEVLLVSHQNVSFDARISEREVFGLVKGGGSFKVYLGLIPKEEIVSEKDLVVTAALGGIFPAGLLVGEVRRVQKTDPDPFQKTEVEPGFKVKDLDYLFIITSF